MSNQDDQVLKGFTDLDQPYPGRRKPVNRTVNPVKEVAAPWDAHPAKTKYVVNGVEEPEFFYIGALATALGYSKQSIRLWESQGLLPNTPYRAPRAAAPMAGGRSTKNRRLWTRAQIEGILRLAKKHQVILNRVPPTPDFARDVAKLFNELLGES